MSKYKVSFHKHDDHIHASLSALDKPHNHRLPEESDYIEPKKLEIKKKKEFRPVRSFMKIFKREEHHHQHHEEHEHQHHEEHHHHHHEEHHHHHHEEHEHQHHEEHEHQHHEEHEHQHHEEHEHDHCDHDHDDGLLSKDDEGCPCCAAAIDLDEVATALIEGVENTKHGEEGGHSNEDFFQSEGGLTSGDELDLGVFIGIAGTLSLVGLTAAWRNIKGTINNIDKLQKLSDGLEKDIARYKHRMKFENSKDNKKNYNDLLGVVQRLEAFKRTINYSTFDTEFNFVVPGIINGSASIAVLSTAFSSSPLALPIIALYAASQTVRNAYDLHRIWNKVLPTELRDDVEISCKIGNKKVNQITSSKRKFYAANALGFSVFAAGAASTAAGSLTANPPLLFAGVGMMGSGAISTAITNNYWTNKFKSRNADLGIAREKLHLGSITKEIAKRRQVKKLIKNFNLKKDPDGKGNKKLIAGKLGANFGYSLLASLPFLQKYGMAGKHKVNKKRIANSNASIKDVSDLLNRKRLVQAFLDEPNTKENEEILASLIDFESYTYMEKLPHHIFNAIEKSSHGSSIIEPPTVKLLFEQCKTLKIDDKVIQKLIDNAVLGYEGIHSVKDRDSYFQKISECSAFSIDKESEVLDLNIEEIEGDDELRKLFLTTVQEYLIIDEVETLRYEQYGLNDFYWALRKQNKHDAKEILINEEIENDEILSESTLDLINNYITQNQGSETGAKKREFEEVKKNGGLKKLAMGRRLEKLIGDIELQDAYINILQDMLKSDKYSEKTKEAFAKSKIFTAQKDGTIDFEYDRQKDIENEDLLLSDHDKHLSCDHDLTSCSHANHHQHRKSHDSKLAQEVENYADKVVSHIGGDKEILNETKLIINKNIKEQELLANPNQAYNGCGIKGSFKNINDSNGEFQSQVIEINEIFESKTNRFVDKNDNLYNNSILVGKNITHIKVKDDHGHISKKEIQHLTTEEISLAFHSQDNDTVFIIEGGIELRCKVDKKELYVTTSCKSQIALDAIFNEDDRKGEMFDFYKHGIEALMTKGELLNLTEKANLKKQESKHKNEPRHEMPKPRVEFFKSGPCRQEFKQPHDHGHGHSCTGHGHGH